MSPTVVQGIIREFVWMIRCIRGNTGYANAIFGWNNANIFLKIVSHRNAVCLEKIILNVCDCACVCVPVCVCVCVLLCWKLWPISLQFIAQASLEKSLIRRLALTEHCSIVLLPWSIWQLDAENWLLDVFPSSIHKPRQHTGIYTTFSFYLFSVRCHKMFKVAARWQRMFSPAIYLSGCITLQSRPAITMSMFFRPKIVLFFPHFNT